MSTDSKDGYKPVPEGRRAVIEQRRARRLARIAAGLSDEPAVAPWRPPADGLNGEKAPRIPKRQHAVLIAYSGTGWNGLQYHPPESGAVTVENTIFDALVRVGAVSVDNADDPYKLKWQRAARTDAGVHALANVLSAQLCVVPDLVAKLNALLPPNIRAWDVVRVQNSFNAHTFCESRYYSYTLPTYLLRPPLPGSHLHARIRNLSPPTGPVSYVPDEERFDFRVSSELLDKMRALTTPFIGKHFFHNFTTLAPPGDLDSRRNIHTITIDDPFVRSGLEWVKINLHGQSFIMHQIRKMTAALVLCARTDTPGTVLRALMDRRAPGRTHVPRGPAPGLVLERPVFDGYYRKLVNDPKPNAVATSAITFEPFAAQQEAFREEFLWSTLLEKEPEFARWMQAIDAYDGPDLAWLGPHGAARVDDPAPPPPPADEEKPVSSLEILDGQRVRFSYFVLGTGWVRATIPFHSSGWRWRRFQDRIADRVGAFGNDAKGWSDGTQAAGDGVGADETVIPTP